MIELRPSRALVLLLVSALLVSCGNSSRGGSGPPPVVASSTASGVAAPAATTPAPTSSPVTSGTTATSASSTPASPSAPRKVSAAGFIQLPKEGPGFVVGSVPERRWGRPEMILGLERVARRWQTERPAGAAPRIRIGDVSFENGGPISGHASHQLGVDVDIALPRGDGQDLPRIDRFSAAYSKAAVQKLVDLCREEMKVTHVFFNDPDVTGVSKWPNHDNHIHVRIKK